VTLQKKRHPPLAPSPVPRRASLLTRRPRAPRSNPRDWRRAAGAGTIELDEFLALLLPPAAPGAAPHTPSPTKAMREASLRRTPPRPAARARRGVPRTPGSAARRAPGEGASGEVAGAGGHGGSRSSVSSGEDDSSWEGDCWLGEGEEAGAAAAAGAGAEGAGWVDGALAGHVFGVGGAGALRAAARAAANPEEELGAAETALERALLAVRRGGAATLDLRRARFGRASLGRFPSKADFFWDVASLLPACAGLRVLRLDGTAPGPAGVLVLARALPGAAGLRELSLGENGLGDAEAAELAEGLARNGTLKTLSLRDNCIATGAVALARALLSNAVQTLSLSPSLPPSLPPSLSPSLPTSPGAPQHCADAGAGRRR
jgi:hypothetical protein